MLTQSGVDIRHDGDLVDPSEYVLLSTTDGLSYYAARLKDGYGWTADEEFSVRGTFGTSVTPPAIKSAVLEIAALTAYEPPKVIGNVGVGTLNDPTQPDVLRITKQYLSSYKLNRKVSPNG